MRRAIGSPLGVGLLAGLLSLDFAAAAKPPRPTPTPTPVPTGCTTCEIAYTRAKDYTKGPMDLMLMKKDGSSKTVLLAGATGVFHRSPEWSPDGQWIAFSTTAASGNRLRVIKADGSTVSDIASYCSGASVLGWRSPQISGGYWLVYSDSRDESGCIVTPPPGETTVLARNLWAVHVSLGAPILVGESVCLTCGLFPESFNYWITPAWSRDGLHFSARRDELGLPDRPRAFVILYVDFESGRPVVTSTWVPVIPEMTLGTYWPESWARWSDSFLQRTNAVDGTHGLVRYDVDFATRELSPTPIVTGRADHFSQPQWSADDSRAVDDFIGTGRAETDGIYVITFSPFSLQLIAPASPYYTDSPDWNPTLP